MRAQFKAFAQTLRWTWTHLSAVSKPSGCQIIRRTFHTGTLSILESQFWRWINKTDRYCPVFVRSSHRLLWFHFKRPTVVEIDTPIAAIRSILFFDWKSCLSPGTFTWFSTWNFNYDNADRCDEPYNRLSNCRTDGQTDRQNGRKVNWRKSFIHTRINHNLFTSS